MASVARTAPAGRFRRALVAAAAAVLGLSCTGTEHVVFVPISPAVTLPPEPMDAAEPQADAAEPAEAAVPDDAAAPDEDAGGDEGPSDPDLDPTITFDWNETLPGQGTCRAGQYIGSFTCTVPPASDASVSPPLTFSGQVVFTLGISTEQQLLAISEGAVKDMLGFEAAHLRGSLRCHDKTFTAQTVNGFSWVPFGAFEASLSGNFDDQTLVIEGECLMTNTAGERCDGTFHVSAAP